MMLLKLSKLLNKFVIILLVGVTVNCSLMSASFAWDFLKEFKSCVSGGCDPVKAVKKGFDNTVEEAGEHMAKGASEEFKKTMDYLFDNKMAPLIKDITSAQKEIIDHASSETEKRINQLDSALKARLEQVSSVMQEAIDKFSKATNEMVDKIKKDVIDNTFSKLDQLRKDFRQDIDEIFERANYFVDTVDCTADKIASDVERLAEQFKSLFRSNTDDFCFKSVGISAFPARFEYTTLYELNKCYLLVGLDPSTTPIKRIRDAYLDLKALANRMSCIQRGAGKIAKERFRKDWWEFGNSYDFWDNLSRQSNP